MKNYLHFTKIYGRIQNLKHRNFQLKEDNESKRIRTNYTMD